ncbi:MAG: hypothetical protein ACREL4_01265 [Gemmatimonadales bacterium]
MTDDVSGAMWAVLAVLGGIGILGGLGAPVAFAVGLPVGVTGVIGWGRWAYLKSVRPKATVAGLTSGEVDAMRVRLDDMDALQARLAEVEERLDFSERLLAQHGGSPDLLRGGKT